MQTSISVATCVMFGFFWAVLWHVMLTYLRNSRHLRRDWNQPYHSFVVLGEVREALAELELPYELVSCGKGSRHRSALTARMNPVPGVWVMATMQRAHKLRVTNMFVFAANVSGQGTALRMPSPHLGRLGN